MLFALVFYFLLVVAVAALLFLAPVRDWALQQARACWQGGRQAGARLQHRAGRQASAAREGTADAAGRAVQGLRARALPLALALLLVAGLPLLAWSLRAWVRADSFDDTATHQVDERVAALLQGEQLVPPAPLPPELFVTQEVEQWRPLARYASRQWDLLDGEFRQRLLLVFKLMAERHGYSMVLIEGYRSPERQAQLASLGPSVTRAGAGNSYHQYGLAADCAFLRNGRIVISEQDPWAARGYELYGEVAASLGLTWGGGWSGLKDLGHVELRRAGVLRGAGDNRPAAVVR